jgi:hypothetical protein
MGKVWVLDTETKGTGANVVPLERATKRSSVVEPVLVERDVRSRDEPQPAPRPAPRFRIIDVMTRQTLADDVDTREAAKVLNGIRSVVDVIAYVRRDPEADWQLLPRSDLRVLWDLAHAEAQAHPTVA